jgi:diketogulonate reductase-like aldo/keto reductase
VQLGQALRKSGIPREQFFIKSKVWNDAVKEGRAVSKKALRRVYRCYGDYFDAFLVHWPVPGCFVPAWKELGNVPSEGALRQSNFNFSIEGARNCRECITVFQQ